MGRLIGYMANRADRLPEALAEEKLAVGETPSASADAWGIGFYQGGEVLHKKRPHRGGDHVSWNDIAGNVRTDVAIIHLRTATVGDYRAENTHPFRMRQWLFAHVGTVAGFDAIKSALLDPMPDFLRRNVRGTTDSEVIFHSLLSFLDDAGRLDDVDAEPKTLLSAARSTLSLVERLGQEVGAPPSTLSFVLTNGRQMMAVRRGLPVSYVEREIGGDARTMGRGPGSTLRYVMVVGGDTAVSAPEHQPLDDGQALLIDRELRTTLHKL
ncbi:MAG: class II glutamine amidotransferase [Sandaracinus sp.]